MNKKAMFSGGGNSRYYFGDKLFSVHFSIICVCDYEARGVFARALGYRCNGRTQVRE